MAEQEQVSFAADIRPLFRDVDIDHMGGMGVPLDEYEYMSQRENAQNVLDFLNGKKEPQMPPGGPFWTGEQLDLLSRWIDGGCRP
jgi:hypothetical protein